MSGSIPTSWIFKETLNHKHQETFQTTFLDEDLEKTLVWTTFPKHFGLYEDAYDAFGKLSPGQQGQRLQHHWINLKKYKTCENIFFIQFI